MATKIFEIKLDDIPNYHTLQSKNYLIKAIAKSSTETAEGTGVITRVNPQKTSESLSGNLVSTISGGSYGGAASSVGLVIRVFHTVSDSFSLRYLDIEDVPVEVTYSVGGRSITKTATTNSQGVAYISDMPLNIDRDEADICVYGSEVGFTDFYRYAMKLDIANIGIHNTYGYNYNKYIEINLLEQYVNCDFGSEEPEVTSFDFYQYENHNIFKGSLIMLSPGGLCYYEEPLGIQLIEQDIEDVDSIEKNLFITFNILKNNNQMIFPKDCTEFRIRLFDNIEPREILLHGTQAEFEVLQEEEGYIDLLIQLPEKLSEHEEFIEVMLSYTINEILDESHYYIGNFSPFVSGEHPTLINGKGIFVGQEYDSTIFENSSLVSYLLAGCYGKFSTEDLIQYSNNINVSSAAGQVFRSESALLTKLIKVCDMNSIPITNICNKNNLAIRFYPANSHTGDPTLAEFLNNQNN